jgi:hypothetical protein
MNNPSILGYTCSKLNPMSFLLCDKKKAILVLYFALQKNK